MRSHERGGTSCADWGRRCGRVETSDRGTWSWSAASPLVSGERAARRDGGHLKMTQQQSCLRPAWWPFISGLWCWTQVWLLSTVQNENIGQSKLIILIDILIILGSCKEIPGIKCFSDISLRDFEKCEVRKGFQTCYVKFDEGDIFMLLKQFLINLNGNMLVTHRVNC